MTHQHSAAQEPDPHGEEMFRQVRRKLRPEIRGRSDRISCHIAHTLSAPDSNLTSFVYFTGIWGDVEYPGDNARQKTVPVFGLKRFVSGSQGPIWKELVRTGLFPDHPEPKTWVQWAVGVFMSWYPCCLRGWRAVVSLAVVVGSVVLVVMVIRHGVKRYRMKGYKRIDTEIPLDDLDFREDAASHCTEDGQR